MSHIFSRCAVVLLATLTQHAAGGTGKDVYPHDHSAEGRFMRKEGAVVGAAAATQEASREVPAAQPSDPKAWVSPPHHGQQAKPEAPVAAQIKEDEPAGYVSRGQDCIGDQAIAPMYLHNAPLVACANHCNKLSGCKGFTYKKSSQSCFFKGFTCKKTTQTGMEFYQKETCKYDVEACRAAVGQSGLKPSPDFAISLERASGCLSYKEGPKKGLAFYGLGARGEELRIEEQQTEEEDLPHYLQKVPGFGCSSSSSSEAQASGAILSQMEQTTSELVLEDELERVAKLSPSELAREVAENRGELRPVQIELLAPGQHAPITDSARLRLAEAAAASAVELEQQEAAEDAERADAELEEQEEEEEEEEEEGLEHDLEEDDEDRQLFPERTA